MLMEDELVSGSQTLADLNEAQRAAVTHLAGPLMIVAGAGTGKTSVITRRIAHLVETGLAKPHQILALTFTEKAAQEMQERVDMLLPYGQAEAHISTFHAFGDRLLREYAVELGLDPDFQVLSQAEQVIFLRKHLFELPLKRYRPLGNPTGYLQALLKHIAKLKDEIIDPQAYEDWARGLVEQADLARHRAWQDRAQSQLELALCYRRFQELAWQNSLLDYGDQIYLTLRLLRERPAVLLKLQETYRYVLVDEFQDTNLAQFELVRLLVAPHGNLTVVGDDDQSIYAFRGAAISNILQFQTLFPKARQVVLTNNYRSLQPILDCAYRLIANNNPDRLEVRNNIDKRLVAASSAACTHGESPIEYFQFDTVSSEADAVASKIAELLEDDSCDPPVSFSDIAILLRVNRDSDAYLRALNYHGIPYRFSGSEGLYNKGEIKILLSFIRVLADPKDNLSLFYLASSAVYNFPMTQLMGINAVASERHLPLLEVFLAHGSASEDGLDVASELDGLRPLGERAQAVLQRMLNDYHQFSALIPSLTPGRLLYSFVEETGWLKTLAAGEQGDSQAQVQNTARFFDILSRFEEQHPGALLPQFVEHLNQLIEAGDSPGVVEADPDSEAVQVLTVHASKGLEFPVVFLVGLNEGKFPGRPRSQALEFPQALTAGGTQPGDPEEDEQRLHVQEERRLFYVGITRAKRYLWLSNALDTGTKITRKRSRFVYESLGGSGRNQIRSQGAAVERLQRMAPVQAPEALDLPAMADDRVLSLSYYRIRDYLDCPKKYQFSHVLRLPVATDPAVMYGRAIHSSISSLLEARLKGEDLSLEEMQAHFSSLWVPVGFLNSQHERSRYKAGLMALERFYEREKTASAATLVEHSFSIRLEQTRLVGRWDRVDGNEARGVILTDYKCAEVESQEKANELTSQNLQLALYALAYTATSSNRQLPSEVRLHFLDSDIVGRAEPDPSRLADAHQKIARAGAGIRARNYEAVPVFGACQRCAYRSICPSAV